MLDINQKAQALNRLGCTFMCICNQDVPDYIAEKFPIDQQQKILNDIESGGQFYVLLYSSDPTKPNLAMVAPNLGEFISQVYAALLPKIAKIN